MKPDKSRRSATFGISTYEISASEIAYPLSKNVSGTRNTANIQRHSKQRLIQGSRKLPWWVSGLAVEGEVDKDEVVKRYGSIDWVKWMDRCVLFLVKYCGIDCF